MNSIYSAITQLSPFRTPNMHTLAISYFQDLDAVICYQDGKLYNDYSPRELDLNNIHPEYSPTLAQAKDIPFPLSTPSGLTISAPSKHSAQTRSSRMHAQLTLGEASNDGSLMDLVGSRRHFCAKTAKSHVEAELRHLHSLGFVHCDVKPDNVLFYNK
ncbi:hypothetical protein CC78DRAFT_588332 [Lojkania enalia]|uniref:Protein kinase domain-containing protein n=1 Tax=Lojkania enalia TaxID=147567 RepID=A0A9P4MWW3_9PLEO|nr:hypothetical protein CC78DRAFT_588332 [Didymosphaeria enalia]